MVGVGILSLITGIMTILYSLYLLFQYQQGGLFALGGIVLLLIGVLCIKSEIKKQEEKAEAEERNAIERDKYYNSESESNLPKSKYIVCHGNYYLWRSEYCICWFPAKAAIEDETAEMQAKIYKHPYLGPIDRNYKITNIPLDRIYFYKQAGGLITNTSGSGGHSSYSMITGFHGKINPVNISTKVEDSRCTQLFYESNGKDYTFELAYDDFVTLKKLLPEKSLDIVNAALAAKTENIFLVNNNDPKGRLEKVKTLFEEGILTEAEYNTKREEIVKSI